MGQRKRWYQVRVWHKLPEGEYRGEEDVRRELWTTSVEQAVEETMDRLQVAEVDTVQVEVEGQELAYWLYDVARLRTGLQVEQRATGCRCT